jgi:HPt (histidine-containing phosphotransfer) domain-containing protein
MLQVFIDKSNVELLQLVEYSEQGDWDNVAGIAHKMKPSLAYLSMKQVEEIIQQIHFLAKNKEQTEKIPKLVANVQSLLEFIIQQLKEEIKKIND